MTESDYVWGVDVSTKRVAVAFHGRDKHVEAVEFDKTLRDGERLENIHFETFKAALRWRSEFPPFFVFVEEPVGRYSKPQLMYAAGVIQEAIYEALDSYFAFPVEVRTVPSPQWKVHSVGRGNATKEQVLDWAKGEGYWGEDQDEADAFGVAFAGARMLGRTSEGAA